MSSLPVLILRQKPGIPWLQKCCIKSQVSSGCKSVAESNVSCSDFPLSKGRHDNYVLSLCIFVGCCIAWGSSGFAEQRNLKKIGCRLRNSSNFLAE